MQECVERESRLVQCNPPWISDKKKHSSIDARPPQKRMNEDVKDFEQFLGIGWIHTTLLIVIFILPYLDFVSAL